MVFYGERHPGARDVVPAATRGFRLNHSMLRVKDPQVSLAFYTHGSRHARAAQARFS